jgi:preprotein translocase subunit SecB
MSNELTESDLKSLSELVRAVSDRVQILEVRLLESRSEQKQFDVEVPGHITTSIDVDTHFDSDNLRLSVYPHLHLLVKQKNAAPQDYFLRIEARFVVTYQVRSDEGLNQSNYDAFAERNGIYNVWPYWREFVQSMTARMGLPPLTIPVFRVGTAKLKQDASLPPPKPIKQITAQSGGE